MIGGGPLPSSVLSLPDPRTIQAEFVSLQLFSPQVALRVPTSVEVGTGFLEEEEDRLTRFCSSSLRLVLTCGPSVRSEPLSPPCDSLLFAEYAVFRHVSGIEGSAFPFNADVNLDGPAWVI